MMPLAVIYWYGGSTCIVIITIPCIQTVKDDS